MALDDSVKADLLAKEWEFFTGSVERNFDNLNRYRIYALALVVVFLGIDVSDKGSLDPKAVFLLAPILLVLMFRMSAEMQYMWLKFNRFRRIEEIMSKLNSPSHQYWRETGDLLAMGGPLRQPNLPMQLLSLGVLETAIILTEYASIGIDNDSDSTILDAVEVGMHSGLAGASFGMYAHVFVTTVFLVWWIVQWGHLMSKLGTIWKPIQLRHSPPQHAYRKGGTKMDEEINPTRQT